MGIPGINDRAPQQPAYINQAAELSKGLGTNEKVKEAVRDIISLLGSEAAVRVMNRPASSTDKDVGSQNTITGVPSLDNPSDPESVRANLEALLAYLKLENDEKQAEMAKGRIEMQKGELEKRHGEQIEKLKESFEQMDKAAKSSLLTKLFGWMMTALAIAFAVAASIATGGIAIGAVVGAAVALTMSILNETGAMDKITEAITEALKDAGMSERAASILTAVLITLVVLLATAGTSWATGLASGAGGAASAAANTANSLQTTMAGLGEALRNVMTGLGLVSTAAGAYAGYEGYKSGMAQADVKEMEKFLSIIRQQLEESQEELNAILEQIQNSVSSIIDILTSETDVQNEIAQNIGAMA